MKMGVWDWLRNRRGRGQLKEANLQPLPYYQNTRVLRDYSDGMQYNLIPAGLFDNKRLMSHRALRQKTKSGLYPVGRPSCT